MRTITQRGKFHGIIYTSPEEKKAFADMQTMNLIKYGEDLVCDHEAELYERITGCKSTVFK